MTTITYSTDSDEHLINIGEKTEPDMDLMEALDLEQQLHDDWDAFMEHHPDDN
jgi:hypothetical protein